MAPSRKMKKVARRYLKTNRKRFARSVKRPNKSLSIMGSQTGTIGEHLFTKMKSRASWLMAPTIAGGSRCDALVYSNSLYVLASSNILGTSQKSIIDLSADYDASSNTTIVGMQQLAQLYSRVRVLKAHHTITINSATAQALPFRVFITPFNADTPPAIDSGANAPCLNHSWEHPDTKSLIIAEIGSKVQKTIKYTWTSQKSGMDPTVIKGNYAYYNTCNLGAPYVSTPAAPAGLQITLVTLVTAGAQNGVAQVLQANHIVVDTVYEVEFINPRGTL